MPGRVLQWRVGRCGTYFLLACCVAAVLVLAVIALDRVLSGLPTPRPLTSAEAELECRKALMRMAYRRDLRYSGFRKVGTRRYYMAPRQTRTWEYVFVTPEDRAYVYWFTWSEELRRVSYYRIPRAEAYPLAQWGM